MKQLTLLFAISLFLSCTIHAQDRITADDLRIIIGNWEGSLTYLNYSNNEPFTMPANLKVEEGKNSNQLILNNIYPNEPQANGSYKLRLKKKGRMINKDRVKSRTVLENGDVVIITETPGRDANKKALIRLTYTLGPNTYSTRKDVQFTDSSEWIKRNEFSYKRKERKGG